MSEGRRRKYDDLLNELRAKQENLGDFDGPLKTRAKDSSPLHGPLVSDVIRLGPTGPNWQGLGQAGGGFVNAPEPDGQRRYDDLLARMRAEPQAPPREQHGATGSWEPEPPSMANRFLAAGETAADTLRGGIRGLTMGYGDRLEAGVRSMLPGGGSYADEFAKQNAYHDAAAERSPYGYNIAKTLGGAPWDLGAAVVGAPGGLAGEVASSAGLSALRGAGMSRSPTREGMTEDAATGFAEGGLWGLGGGVLGRAVGAGSEALTSLAPKARATALGEIGPAARAQRKVHGDEYVENLPAVADELGMTPRVPMDWSHPVDSLRQKLTFRSPGGYAKEAKRLKDEVHGPAKGQAIADATAQGASAPRDEVIGGLRGLVRDADVNLDLDPYAGYMGRLEAQVPPGTPVTGAPDQLSVAQLDKLKQGWERGGYRKPGENVTPSEGLPKQAQRDAAGVVRGQMHDAIDTMATDETARAFHSANDAYGQAADIENMARAKQLDLDTQNPFSLPNVGRTLGGVAGGASIGGALGGLPGMVVGAGLGYVAQKGAQQYGPDMAADFLRSGGSPLHPSTMQRLADQPLPFGQAFGGMRDAAVGGTIGGAIAGPAGAVVGGTLGALGRPGIQGATGAGAGAYGARDRGEPDADMAARFVADTSRDSLEQGRGYMLTDAVMDALRNEPQMLGPYLQQFGAAAGGDPGAVSALIKQLSATDERFRTQVLPALRERTAGGL